MVDPDRWRPTTTFVLSFFVRVFVRSVARSCVCSFVRLFVRSCVRSFGCSLVRVFFRLFVRLFQTTKLQPLFHEKDKIPLSPSWFILTA